MSEDSLPPFLHRYRPVEDLEKGHLREVLLDNKIYAPSPALFNDPFDCRARLQHSDDPKVYRRLLDRYLRKHEPGLGHTARAKKITRIMSQGRWRKPEIHAAVERDLQEFMNRCGILCLCESGTVPLMWAHYASGHRGFCFRFRSQPETIFRQIEKVEYSLEYPVPSLGGDIDEDLHALFRTKAKWWEYENEWRFIGNREGAGHRIFPAEALNAVILGCRVSTEAREQIRELVSQRPQPLKILQAEPGSSTFELELREIEGVVAQP